MADDPAANAADPVQSYYGQIAAALAIAGRNATSTQQQGWITAQAAMTMGIATLNSLDTAAAGQATAKELKGN